MRALWIALLGCALASPARAQLGPQDRFTPGVTSAIPAGTAVPTGASTMVVPAAASLRVRAVIYNLTPVGGSGIWCRSDGGTAAVGSGVPIPAGGGYEWDYPLVGPGAITCVAATAAVTVGGEYVQ